ncbi:MAG: CPBP family intramembrane glutamic endopeptidase [Candidatus Helarchaeota archaeon]
MIFSPVNLLYFVIVAPVVLIVTYFMSRLDEDQKHLTIICILGALLFFVRIMLVVFSPTIGVMPYIFPDVIFYTILMFFGVAFSTFYLLKVEKKTFAEIGFKKDGMAKNILVGLLALLPLIAMFPLLLILAGIQISLLITWEKIVLGIVFGLILGGYYEEVMFRGIIQNHFMAITDEKNTVLFTALVFVATHIGYLPFSGFGIMYLFLFVMALELSYLRLKFNQISCAILHGGIVFILVLFI